MGYLCEGRWWFQYIGYDYIVYIDCMVFTVCWLRKAIELTAHSITFFQYLNFCGIRNFPNQSFGADYLDFEWQLESVLFDYLIWKKDYIWMNLVFDDLPTTVDCCHMVSSKYSRYISQIFPIQSLTSFSLAIISSCSVAQETVVWKGTCSHQLGLTLNSLAQG